jgi:hypothetical protein
MEILVRMERIVSEKPHNGGNSHNNLHVSRMMLGSSGSCSSPLGVLFLSPKGTWDNLVYFPIFSNLGNTL